jgi:Xaa-Pro aminopeptidase
METAVKMNNRLAGLRRQFAEKGIDAIFITNASNRRYLSGFIGSAGYLLITAEKSMLATDFRYTEQAATEAPDFEIRRISGKLIEWFPVLVQGYGVKRLGFEASDVSFEFYQQLKGALTEKQVMVEMVPLTSFVGPLRAVKEPREIEFIRKASAIADKAFESVEKKIKAGMTEKQIAWELEKCMRESGSQSLPFEIIVGSGPNAALPHAKPTDRVINEGEAVVIDMGAKVDGYATDLTRTICAGKPDDKFKKIYHTVLEAQAEAISLITAGMTGHQADSVAREIIEQAGYGDNFGHSLGHGVGLDEHELPRLGPGSNDTLAESTVFTIEPGIYLTGWGGVRIEDTVFIENGKVKPLTKARKLNL